MPDVLFTPLGVRLPRRYIPNYPHPPQEAFLWLDCLDAFYGGSAGPGKSWALLAAALQYVDVPGYAAILFRRTYEDLKLPGALIPRSKDWLWGTDAKWNENDHRWTFPSGATLSFGYLQHADDHLRYQGAEFNFIGVDEASQIRENQLRYLFSRLRRPDANMTDAALAHVPVRMRLASNPGDRSHEYLKRRYIDKLPDPNDPEDTPERAQERAFIRAKLQDNPSLDQAAYRSALSHLEPEVRAQLLDGDWDARQPGDWYFDDRHLAAVITQGRALERLLELGELLPSGGVLHLGIDWGESTHALLGWPLDSGGWFIAREYADSGGEPSAKTLRMLALNEWDHPWGRAYFDAAGVQSQKTFNATAERAIGYARPSAKSVPFGARAPGTARGAARSFKGVGCSYLRRMARRAYGTHVLGGLEVTENAGGVFIPGPVPGYLAISPQCPVLVRQLKAIQRDPEDPQGSWLKDDDQHGPDAAVALVAGTGVKQRVAVST
jgi:hypothetical protein